MHRLMELREASGKDIDEEILEALLDSDHEFDVAEWDAEMEDVFDEDYYKVPVLPDTPIDV